LIHQSKGKHGPNLWQKIITWDNLAWNESKVTIKPKKIKKNMLKTKTQNEEIKNADNW
jgi:hypothetical protein